MHFNLVPRHAAPMHATPGLINFRTGIIITYIYVHIYVLIIESRLIYGGRPAALCGEFGVLWR